MKCGKSLVLLFALTCVLGRFGAEAYYMNFIERELASICREVISPYLKEEIQLEAVTGVYNEDGLLINYNTGDMKLLGANDYNLETYLSLQELAAVITIDFPIITVTGDHYNLYGDAYVFYPLSGAGLMNITIRDIRAMLLMTLDPYSCVQFKDIKIDLTVGKMQVYLENSSEPINEVLNANSENIVKKFRATVLPQVNRSVDQLKNDLNRAIRETLYWLENVLEGLFRDYDYY